MLSERDPQIENREKEPIDFAQIFREKLDSIKPNKNNERSIRLFKWPKEMVVEKQTLALVFNIRRQISKFDLWIEDWQDIKSYGYPHHEAQDNLENFLHKKGGRTNLCYSAQLVKDQKGKLWLWVDEALRDKIEGCKEDDSVERWLEFCERYGIEKIIGDAETEIETREILNQDIVGQIREERHLLDFIERHRDSLDTTTKILRFRVLAETAREAAKEQKKPYSLEGLLEDMAKENGRVMQ